MRKKVKLLLGSGGGVLASLSVAGPAFAQINLFPPNNYNNLRAVTPEKAIGTVIQILLFAAFIIAFIFLVIGGIRWMMAGGDKAAAESARGTLTAAIIGLIVVLAAWALLILIERLFGITIVSGPLAIPKFY